MKKIPQNSNSHTQEIKYYLKSYHDECCWKLDVLTELFQKIEVKFVIKKRKHPPISETEIYPLY